MKKTLIPLTIILFSLHCNRPDQSAIGPITPQAVYSAEDPGNWAGKEDEHTPVVKITSDDGEGNVVVSVTLQNPSPSHYIEKIFIADKTGKPYTTDNGRDLSVLFNNTGIGSVTAQPGDGANSSVFQSGNGKTWRATFTMPVNSQTKRDYAVYARCSQHDLWMAGLKQ